MSQPSSPPPVLRTELETVVCWPLIYSAGGLVLLALTTVAGLAAYSALGKAPSAEQAVVRSSEAPVPSPRLTVHLGEPSAEPTPVVETPAQGAPPVVQPAAPPVVRFYPDGLAPAPRPAPIALAVPPSEPLARVARAGKAPAPAPRPYRYRPPMSEDDLLAQLAQVPELDLEKEKGTKAKLLAKAPKGGKAGKRALTHPVLDVVAVRADLRGLPMRDERDCVAADGPAHTLALMSRDVRRLQARRALEQQRLRALGARRGAPSTSDGHALAESAYAEMAPDQELVRNLLARKGWKDGKAVGPLMQMLQPDSLLVRTELVKMLAVIKGRAATEALARLAVFDLSFAVRKDAIAALAKRPVADARPVFLSALRYPWAPAADHAAEALVTLDDRKSAGALESLLALPDPSAPYLNKDKKLVVTELVRVNHLRNCLLCHAASSSPTDRVRGLAPTPGKAIPVVYYERGRGDFVRADVTYLQQDFSTMLRVADAVPWPEMQRYDYLLRTRELGAAEQATRASLRALAVLGDGPLSGASYPQKEAVLFAFERLRKERLAKEAD